MRKPLKLIHSLGQVIVFVVLMPGAYVYSQDHSKRDSTDILEKVYIHTDRETYSQGDDIWFKAYLVNGSSCILSVLSSSLHVELISPEGIIIDSRVIKMMNGLGNGDFHITDSIRTGKYRLRAYTNHMRNFGNDIFFIKELIIINTKKSKDTSVSSYGPDNKEVYLSFFPEGGSLIEEVSSKVAFKALDNEGHGVSVSGEVYSSDSVIVAKFASVHDGMGSFYLTPRHGSRYFAVIKEPLGPIQNYDLPDAFQSGLVLGLKPFEAEKLVLELATNQDSYSTYSNSVLNVAVSQHDHEYSRFQIRLTGLNNKITIPKDELPLGVIRLTVSDSNMKPFCERLAYIPEKFQTTLTIKANRTFYEKRDSVTLSLALSDSSKTPDLAFLSLSAVENIPGQGSDYVSTICSSFLLESELKGNIEDPSYYFDLSHPDRDKDLDLLLMVNGWRDFSWKYSGKYFPYENGFTFSGKVRKRFSDNGIKNSSVALTIFKDKETPNVTSIPTDTAGKFSLEGIQFNGMAFIVATAMDGSSKMNGLLIVDSIKYEPPETTGNNQSVDNYPVMGLKRNSTGFEILSDRDTSIIKKYRQIAEVKNSILKKYKLTDTIVVGEVSVTARRVDPPTSAEYRARYNLHGSPDKTVLITPEYYKAHRDLRLVTRSLIFSSNIKMPAFVIDGSKVSYEIFSAYPWDMVERIDVLTTMASIAVFGPNTQDPANQGIIVDGIISITSRNEPLFSDAIVLHTVKKSMKGYDEPRIFYSPSHKSATESALKPDLRTTLYWRPNIILRSNDSILLNYYNTDNEGRIKVRVEGITAKGIPLSGFMYYDVK